MWKKDELPDEIRTRSPEVAPGAAPGPAPVPPRAETPKLATIGRSIRIKGEVSGDEDLLIQGHVEGSVNLKQHSVTVGPDGKVKASVAGRLVTIQGRVEGDVTAEEQVVLRSSASVQGDITAPRVVLEDGARFRGGVDMGEEPEPQTSGDASVAAAKKPRVERVTAELIESSSGNGAKEKAPAKVTT
jgi:cytoskeletal protein CcmA (bactofilin family)